MVSFSGTESVTIGEIAVRKWNPARAGRRLVQRGAGLRLALESEYQDSQRNSSLETSDCGPRRTPTPLHSSAKEGRELVALLANGSSDLSVPPRSAACPCEVPTNVR